MIDFEYNSGKTSEERVSTALVDIEKHCKQRKNEVRTKQKAILLQMRQDREERQRRAQAEIERKRKAKEHKEQMLKEAIEKQRVEQEAAERERKEQLIQEEAKRQAIERKRKAKEQKERLVREAVEAQRLEQEAAERQRKERLVQEEAERQRIVKEEADREKKEQRRIAREEKRRKKAAIEAASAKEVERGVESPIAKHRLPTETFQRPGGVGSAQDPKTSPTMFSPTFDDELQCENESDGDMNGCGDGCLTQRVGLDVPTPTSHQSDEGQPSTKLRKSKVRWNSTLSTEEGPEASDEVQAEAPAVAGRANLEMESEGGQEGSKTKKERRRVFGSTATDKKARERQEKEKRRMDRYTSSSKENLLQPSSPKSHSSHASKRKNRGHTRERHGSHATSLPVRKRSIDAQEDSASSTARANTKKVRKHLETKSLSLSSSQKEKPTVTREPKSSKPQSSSRSKPVKVTTKETSKTTKRGGISSESNPSDKKLKSSTVSRSRTEKSKAAGRSDRSVISARSAKSVRSARSVTSEKSRRSVSSRASRKRGRSQDASSQQTTGISSGERVASKSRRRRSADPTSKAKARSSGLLGMSDDFGFKF